MKPSFENCLIASRKLIEMALSEDLGGKDLASGIDCTTAALLPQADPGVAYLVCRDQGVICGLEIARLIVSEFGTSVEFESQLADGDPVRSQQRVGVLTGNAGQILTLERTILNFLGRLSGIASLTHQYVQAIAGTKAQILDTRKTTPGWRQLEKYAVACGGGTNHRIGLFDGAMIKDNHLALYRNFLSKANKGGPNRAADSKQDQSIRQAVAEVKNWIAAHESSLPLGLKTPVFLEVDTLEQLQIGLQTSVDSILLDNMDPEKLRQSVALRDRLAPGILLEASGGVNLTTVRGIAEAGVDRISIGALTHSAKNFDIGLDWSEDSSRTN